MEIKEPVHTHSHEHSHDHDHTLPSAIAAETAETTDKTASPPDTAEACCPFLQANPQVVTEIRDHSLDEDEQIDLAELFRMFGDPTRLRILTALGVSELCVCDIAGLLHMTVSAISHQLRLLRASGLVVARRDGKTMVYALADDHVLTILQMGIQHIRE